MIEIEMPGGMITYLAQAHRLPTTHAAAMAWKDASKWVEARHRDCSVWRTQELDRETNEKLDSFVISAGRSETHLKRIDKIVSARGGRLDDEGLGIDTLRAFCLRRFRVALEAAAKREAVHQTAHYGDNWILNPDGTMRPRERRQG